MKKIRKVLLLEDDTLFAESIQDYLEDEGFLVDIVSNGEKALQQSYLINYDIYLLDVNVPKINGIDFLKMVRDGGDDKASIFITSHQDKDTLKKGYETGCDDYMKKPIDLQELLYRINVLLKRRKSLSSKVKLNEKCYYDFKQRAIFCDGKIVKLPLKIIQLLELFLENRSQVVTKEQIIYRLWSASDEYSDGSIRVYINKLKSIIGKDKIENLKSIGYKLTNN